MAAACAGFISCTDVPNKLSECIANMDRYEHIGNLQNMSFMVLPFFYVGWGNWLSLFQNLNCLVNAKADCNAVLACLNQGTATQNCIPPSDHSTGYFCRDGNTLAHCGPVKEGGSTIESSVRCNDLGFVCLEGSLGNDIVSACVNGELAPISGIEVNCNGSMADVHIANGLFRLDCNFFGATCQAGSYSFDTMSEIPFCIGTGSACDSSSFQVSCDGNMMKACQSGQEGRVDCTKLGMVCNNVCSYATCEPYHFEETCMNGVITYCGPNGPTLLSCSSLGFSGCEVVNGAASCVK